jgi:hypothetical protein
LNEAGHVGIFACPQVGVKIFVIARRPAGSPWNQDNLTQKRNTLTPSRNFADYRRNRGVTAAQLWERNNPSR